LNTIIYNDEEIKIKVDGVTLAEFTDGGNGMDGKIEEFDYPHRMDSRQMIELARWLLDKAKDSIFRR